MIKIENLDIHGFESAIRGMRNPLNSWEKSDSHYGLSGDGFDYDPGYIIGDADHELMMKLAKAGSEHSKYRRMIVVYIDVIAPLYLWKEIDTYQVGTVRNSCSTMHKIQSKRFTRDDFSIEYLYPNTKQFFDNTIEMLNYYRDRYNESHDRCDWLQMIQLLPSSYNQRRTLMLNYEVLAKMYRERKNHKLNEWRTFCDWIKTLPYSEVITCD